MPITTVAVTCTAARPDGSLIAGGKFRFLLSNTDTENGLVVPREISATANASGVAVANLWPNSLGALGTQYRVLLSDPLGSTIDLGSCTVPNSACNLHSILGLGTAPTLDQATVAKLAAQTAAAASSTSATQSASSATQAAASATAAAGSATGAANSAASAAGSVTSAATSATAAGNSATSAASSNTSAGASAADALSSKNAAATSATNSASSATSAQTGATGAATSATTATTKASEAATSATNAAISEAAALASKNAAATSETNAQGSATTAATQAGNAATSATNAASNATNAASSATAAASSAAAVAAVTTGNMSSQNANSVAITGGAISGTSITVKDNVLTLQDDVDPTKQAQFQVSAVPTGTTVVYNLPYGTTNPVLLGALNIPNTWTSGQTFSASTGAFGTSVAASTYSVASGATTTGLTKTVNVGTGGLSGSTTAITVGSANGSTTTMLGSTVIGGAAGNQSLQVNNVASAVNYAQVVGAVATGAPILSMQGADTNIPFVILAKGSGDVNVGGTSTTTSLKISTVASQVNSFQVYGQATGQAPTLAAVGTDTDIGISISAKGTGSVSLSGNAQQVFAFKNLSGTDFTNLYNTTGQLNYTAAGGSTNTSFYFGAKGTGSIQFASGGGTQAVVSNTASAVNYLNLTGAATGAAPTISAQGSDANINLNLTPKGVNGAVNLQPNGALTLVVGQSGTGVGNNIAIYPTTNTMNWVLRGTDTNIGYTLQTKGTGNFYYVTGGGQQAVIADTQSAVNYLGIAGSITGAAPSIYVAGSDTNINLKLTAKGTGTLQFGTYTATVLSPTGFITITDAGGTSRRLLVG